MPTSQRPAAPAPARPRARAHLPPGARAHRPTAVRSLALVLALAVATAGSVAGSDAWTLERGLARAEALEVHVEHPAIRAAVELAVTRRGGAQGLALRPIAEIGGGDADLPRAVFVTTGSAAAPRLARPLGVELDGDGGFRFEGLAFGGEDALVATFEDPDRPGLPLSLCLAADAGVLARSVGDLAPTHRPGLVVYRGGDAVLEARLSAGGGRVLDALSRIDAWGAALRASEVETVRGFKLRRLVGVSAASARRYAEQLAPVRRRVLDWAGAGEARPPRVELVLYPDPERKARLLGELEPFTVNHVRSAVHVVLGGSAPGGTPSPRSGGTPSPDLAGDAGTVLDDAGAGYALAAAEALLGRPSAVWLEAGAAYGTAGRYFGRPLERWVARLTAAGRVPSVDELVAPDAERRRSRFALEPLRGFLFGCLLEARGAEHVRALWRGEVRLAGDAELAEAFRARLAANLEAQRPALEQERAAGRRTAGELAPIGGFAVVRRGDPVVAGYASRGAARSFAELAAAGADAAVLSTFAWIEPEPPLYFDLARERRRAAADPDLALVHGALRARAEGLRVMLQPELLTSPSGTHAGQVNWSSPEAWHAFFDDFERFATHYALLAELAGCELFCVGTELGNSTQFEPDLRRKYIDYELLDHKRRRWSEILAEARALFDGALTYAARSSPWGSEVARVDLWDELDLVAVSSFQPPGRDDWGLAGVRREAVVRRLAVQLARLCDVARDAGKPLLLAPIGFPSTASAQTQPWDPRGVPDAGEQALLYRALAEAVARVRAERDELAGFFLWSWSTDPEAGGRSDPGFTPRGKPALELLPQLFGRR